MQFQTPVQSPITRVEGGSSSTLQQQQHHHHLHNNGGGGSNASSRKSSNAGGAHAAVNGAAIAAQLRGGSVNSSTAALVGTQHPRPNSSSATRVIRHNGGHITASGPHGTIQTPLHVEDVEMSVRLMQCLDGLKRPQDAPLENVEKRFRGVLRTTTQKTRDDDWRKRMESVKALREKKQAEIHKRTQMHQLFKHYAFEQRMASRSNTPSVAAATAAAISNSIGGGAAISSGASAATGSAGAMTLFPTTNTSITRQQMDDYFAVPSFVRPLLSTFQRPDSAFPRSNSVSTAGGYRSQSLLQHNNSNNQQVGGASRSSSAYDPAGFADQLAERIDASVTAQQQSASEESFRRAREALTNNTLNNSKAGQQQNRGMR